jgi:purine-binding chemotaxis protein CheW
MQLVKSNNTEISNRNNILQVLIVKLGSQLFGLPVTFINDVLAPQYIHNIPLADKVVAGSLNLRGRIVTAMDLRVILGIEVIKPQSSCMSIVTEGVGELYSFIVDLVDEVVDIQNSDIGPVPANLTSQWRDLSTGIYQSKEKGIVVIIDMQKLINSFTMVS